MLHQSTGAILSNPTFQTKYIVYTFVEIQHRQQAEQVSVHNEINTIKSEIMYQLNSKSPVELNYINIK